MYALSLWQPWAHLAIYGAPDGRVKLWETRSWPQLPRQLVGGRLAIHAAKRLDGGVRRQCVEFGLNPNDLAFGALVGTVYVPRVKWLTYLDEPAALCECHHKVGIGLAHPLPFKPPVTWRGRQGIFRVNIGEVAALAAARREATLEVNNDDRAV